MNGTALPTHLAPPAHSGRFQTFQCDDTHQQAAILQAWNQSYCQLSAGSFAGSVSEIDTGAVRVIVERLNRVVLQRGALSPDCIAVGVPLDLHGPGRLCGQLSHVDGLHVFSGSDGFEFLSPERHLVVDIEFYPQRLGSPALRKCLDGIATRLGKRPAVLDLPSQRMGVMRHTLRNMLEAVAASPDLLRNAPVREAFEKSLVCALSDLLGVHAQAGSAPERRTPRSWRLVQAARALLEQASPDCPLSVAELVSALDVSRRNLQYAFQDALGINPASFLRIERLNRVRRALGDAQSVTEAATRFGFWHFGHFATEYRVLFGELPSETFRRRKGVVAMAPLQVSPSTRPLGGWLN
jgi:AraC family ethanolamine operon transcriptional activator